MTIFKKIRKLLPGHFLCVENGDIRIQQYWDIEFKPNREMSEDDFIEGFMQLLRESVGMHLMNEVPLGVFLSGGTDSQHSRSPDEQGRQRTREHRFHRIWRRYGWVYR